MRKLLWRLGVCIVLGLFLGAARGSAQEFAGITGTVTDKSGSAVPDASVKLTDTRTGANYQSKSGAFGAYLFQKLAPGPGYELSVSKDGFDTFSLTEIYLGVNTTSTYNVELKVGSVQQTIEVKAAGEGTLNTTDASIGNVMNERTLHELPALNRDDVSAFLRLEPGVVSDSGANSDPNGTRDGAVTGARVDQGNITVDGIDANDQNTGQPFTTIGNASLDAVQEVRTVSADPTVDQGRSSGAQIAIITKSGTNQFHGSAREYNRNKFSESNDFFNNRAGVPLPNLNRNQFGANLGGPIKKDKLFFFFDYEGNRLAEQSTQEAIVPYDELRNGEVGYVNNGPGCTNASRRDTQPACISFLSAAQVAKLDPQGIGANAALIGLFQSLYPHVNDPSAGDGINYGGARFNAPDYDFSNTYTTRIDYTITSKQKIFGRVNIVRENATQTAANLPGQPDTTEFVNHDFSFAIGHTYWFSTNNINQFTFGITSNRFSFPAGNSEPTFPNNLSLNSNLNNPYGGISSQYRIAPVPTIRDDFSHVQGRHNLGFGFDLRPFHTTSQNITDFNFIGVGLGGNLSSLGNATNSLRPADILNDPIAEANWDTAFAQELGRYATVSTNYNYGKSGSPLAPGTGKIRTFHQRELEIYAEDSWKVKPNLTLSYGLRWQYEGVPFEENGFETTAQNVNWQSLLATRVANGLNGDPSSPPFLQYSLAGPVNHAPGYYQQYWKNFAPHLGLAYAPDFKSGLLHTVFGDNKTVVRMGGTIAYDRFVAGAFNFIQDQFTYLFQNNATVNFGSADPVASLLTDPRFTGVKAVPQQPLAPVITQPFTPFVDNLGNPFGTANNQSNYGLDPKFRTPYAYLVTVGVQRELPGNFLLEVDYVGRFAHSLFGGADAGQLVDFKDPGSGQLMSTAFNNLATEIRTGTPITNQPFFEDQVFNPPSLGLPSSTALLATLFQQPLQIGDFTTLLQGLAANGLIAPNVGLNGQFVTNMYGANVATSSYNGLLATLRKRLSHNLQFDFNYTYSHSIDSSSFATNASKADVGIFAPTICDAINPRNCRGNSEFDATHIFNANAIYDLPFGRGQRFGRHSSGWVNAIVGGWRVSTIFSAHSGFAINILSGAYSESFMYATPGVLTGSSAVLSRNIHNVPGQNGAPDQIQFFSNPDAVQAAFSFPLVGQAGNRDIARGPSFWNFDSAVVKDFHMPWSDGHKLQFRWETFNTLNHPNFAQPSRNLSNPATFGVVTATVEGIGRIMLLGLRYDF